MLVIGHRGASGHRPEHTLASYRLAAELGADCIEPDLVSTRDGVLVARHENEISQTTDVARRPEFAGRHATKSIDGHTLTGWFTEDFSYEELRTLRAIERIPHLRPANAEFDGRFTVPTLREVLDLATELGVGVYPETKHPAHFRSLGLALEEPLMRELEGFDGPVYLQSFDADSLRRLSGGTLVQLLRRPADLQEIARYADAVGPPKALVVGADGRSTGFVEEAHDAGLLVHPFTFRRENEFLPERLRSGDDPAAPGDLLGELREHVAAGVDGFFCDNPEIGVLAARP